MKRNAFYIYGLMATGSLLISACSSNSSNSSEPDNENTGQTQNISLVPAQSDAQLEAYLKQGLMDGTARAALEDDQPDGTTEETGSSDQAAGDAAQSDTLFSETNLQVQGVDEADKVKFDGEYIYVTENNITPCNFCAEATPLNEPSPVNETPVPPEEISIYQTTDSPAATTKISTITMDNANRHIDGLYLFSHGNNSDNSKDLAVITSKDPYVWSYWNNYSFWSDQHTQLSIYNVNDPVIPTKSWSIDIEGTLIDSRRIEDKLYLVTRHTPYDPSLNWGSDSEENRNTIESLNLDDMLPKSIINSGSSQSLVDSDNCYVPDTSQNNDPYSSPALITISSIDLTAPDSVQSVCIGGNTNGVFASTDALYIFNSNYYSGDNEAGAIIHKFTYTDAGPSYQGSGKVLGSLGWNNPSFRMGENRGALFIVSTTYEEEITTGLGIDHSSQPTHRLTVLKESDPDQDNNLTLEQVAILPNEQNPAPIGKPGERIYSVRYLGDRGYIVTFDKVDPLYVLDLSNPEAPIISGELEIEGYSDYLHPVGENHLLGIGKDAFNDGNTTWYQGIQIGFFDVTDISAPLSIKTELIGMRGSETEVSYDHKAFTFLDYGEGQYRMALPIQVSEGVQNYPSQRLDWKYTGLHLFDINTRVTGSSSMEGAGVLISEQSDESTRYPPNTLKQRGIIKGDSIHYVYGKQILSADWGSPELLEPID